MPQKLTPTLLKNRTPRANTRVQIMDTTVPNFGVRLTPKKRSYFVLYRNGQGRWRRYSITRSELSEAWSVAERRSTAKKPDPLSLELAAARIAARGLLERVESGEDVADTKIQKQGGPGTWNVLLDSFLQDYVGISEPQTALAPDQALSPKRRRRLKFKTAREYQKLVNAQLRPKWRARKLQDVTARDVKNLLQDKRDTPYQANRLLQVVYSVGQWAVREGHLAANPAAGIERYPEDPRERRFTKAEIKALWSAFESAGYPYGTMCQVLLLTGARLGEIRLLKWKEVNLEAGLINLEGDRTKSGREHLLVLSNAAGDVIRQTPAFKHEAMDADAFVFEGRGGNAFAGLSKAKESVDEKSKVKDWRVHDFRRIVGTELASLRVRPHVIAWILGHADQSVTAKHYNKYEYEAERREALELWADHLLNVIVADKKVVPIRG